MSCIIEMSYTDKKSQNAHEQPSSESSYRIDLVLSENPEDSKWESHVFLVQNVETIRPARRARLTKPARLSCLEAAVPNPSLFSLPVSWWCQHCCVSLDNTNRNTAMCRVTGVCVEALGAVIIWPESQRSSYRCGLLKLDGNICLLWFPRYNFSLRVTAVSAWVSDHSYMHQEMWL